MGSWAIGQAIVNVCEIGLGVRAPEPSAADVAYLLSYVLLVSGVLGFVRTPAGYLSPARGAVEGQLIASGVLLCSWSVVIGSVFAHRGPLDLGDLEVTESSFIDGPAPMLDTLRSLHALGVRLAIDDFGTGYASVSNLQRMPIDILKIDRSFRASVTEQAHGANLLEAIVSIACALSLVTIAEGVEEPLQLETARRLGCDVARGYLLGRPMTLADARSVIAAHSAGVPAGTAPRAGDARRGLALSSAPRTRSS